MPVADSLPQAEVMGVRIGWMHRSGTPEPQASTHLSCSTNCLKGVMKGIMWGSILGVTN